MTKLTDTSPAPATPLKALSTADVHAPHVIPSTLRVVVAMCGGVLDTAISAAIPCSQKRGGRRKNEQEKLK
jgi:hypothetical protein